MKITVLENPEEIGQNSGRAAAAIIRKEIEMNGTANIILATGTSQFETLKELVSKSSGIDWSKVVMFHLDEYIGLPETSNASFRKFLRERFLQKVPPLKAVHFIDGETDPEAECNRLGEIIKQHPIHLALVGIGENGHLAFNDPPADFETEEPYIVVDLDEQCRRQQLDEGWFGSLEEVPTQAISMSIKQIMRSKFIVCSVPDSRKATAVSNCLTIEVSNLHPASILQQHQDCVFFLDKNSAANLTEDFIIETFKAG